MKLSYMRPNLPDTYGILELQNKILEIALYLDAFCKKHNITYYLMSGSALGAMRHQGFIPWDDDLDVFMDMKNYQKFVQACKADLDTTRYHFQPADSTELPYLFAKLRANGTAFIETVWANRPDVHQGVFVDIMCLNNAAPTLLGRKIQYYAAVLLKAHAVSRTNYSAAGLKKLQLFIAKYGVNALTKPLLLWLVRRYNKRPTDTVAHLFGHPRYKHCFYPAEDFGTPRYVPFETVQLPVPQKVEDYLTRRFGKNYMQMPDEKTRAQYATHATRWSTTQDYKELLYEQSLYKCHKKNE